MRELICLFFFLTLPALLFANGGPVEMSFTQASGTVKLITEADIELASEDLRVTIHPDHCDVEVRYLLINHGSNRKVTYGFPIDYAVEFGQNPTLYDDHVKDFEFHFAGNSLPYETVLDTLAEEDIKYEVENALEWEVLARTWFTTCLDFPEKGFHELKVKYTIRANYGEYGELNYWNEHGRGRFIYDLSPSGFWGKGNVRSFDMNIDLGSELLPTDVVQVLGVPEVKSLANRWEALIGDFNIKQAGFLEIIWEREPTYLANFMKKNINTEIIEKVEASSSLSNDYSPEHVLDQNRNTAWVEGKQGNGEGEWLLFTLRDNVIIKAIAIVNGYPKSDKLLIENGQVKNLRIDFIPNDGTDVISLNERIEYQENLVGMDESGYRMANLIYSDSYGSMASQKPTKKIKLTLHEVFPGKKYADTCISEVLFFGMIIQ